MPIIFLLFAFPALEIYVFIKVGDHFGYVNALFALLTSSVIGVGIIRAQSHWVQVRLSQSLAAKKLPSVEVIHRLLILLGGVLLLMPGFISDVIGLMLIMPGLRHFFVWTVRWRIERSLLAGTFKMFSFGTGFSAGFGGSSNHSAPDDHRDVSPKVIDVQGQVLDVSPIEIKPSSDKPDNEG
jgi:UPF0716 protein FxsA